MKRSLLFAFLFYATNLAATTYYVSPTGSDAAAGGVGAPWKTISHAASVAVAGDTVNVEDGTYVETVNWSHTGTSGAPITFRSSGVGLLE